MPDPQPGEDREDFLDRCIPQVVREGYDPDQAVAICISYYEGEKDKAFDIPADNRIEYWKAFDRRRQSFEAKYSRRIYRAIKEMLSALDDATNANELQKPLDQSILEEVVRLDSSQTDAVATLGEGNLVEYTDDGSVRPGVLQRLEQMQEYFFGSDEAQGLFDAMRAAEDPNFLENPED